MSWQTVTCWIALRLADLWDWIDRRDIDKHAVSLVILTGTWKLTEWAMHFAATSSRPGLEVAAILGAVCAPYMALQAAALKWYFESRPTLDVNPETRTSK